MLTGAPFCFFLCVWGSFTVFCKSNDLLFLMLTRVDTQLQHWMCMSLGSQLEGMGW